VPVYVTVWRTVVLTDSYCQRVSGSADRIVRRLSATFCLHIVRLVLVYQTACRHISSGRILLLTATRAKNQTLPSVHLTSRRFVSSVRRSLMLNASTGQRLRLNNVARAVALIIWSVRHYVCVPLTYSRAYHFLTSEFSELCFVVGLC
jgi:hypothetical protein